jgi:predicted kinase
MTNKNDTLLTLTVGLPYSGKSTAIVNPDAIRIALHGERYIYKAEPHVWAIATNMVDALFFAGHKTVILDATNNTAKRRDVWQKQGYNIKFAVLNTQAGVCIDRAQSVGDDYIVSTIERMAKAHESVVCDKNKIIHVPGTADACRVTESPSKI